MCDRHGLVALYCSEVDLDPPLPQSCFLAPSEAWSFFASNFFLCSLVALCACVLSGGVRGGALLLLALQPSLPQLASASLQDHKHIKEQCFNGCPLRCVPKCQWSRPFPLLGCLFWHRSLSFMHV